MLREFEAYSQIPSRLNLLNFKTYRYPDILPLFVRLLPAYTQVDIVRADSRCFKPLSSACEQLLFILREIYRFLEVLFEFAY